MSSPDGSAARPLEPVGDAGEGTDPEEVQKLLEAALKLYAGLLEEGRGVPPLPPDTSVSATEVVATVSALLDQVDIEVFELGMWQSWGKV
jgi:hypothetical protein